MNAFSETFVIMPNGGLIEVTGFDPAVDILDLSAFIRSDVSEALLSATGSNNAVLKFFDGTELIIEGKNVSAETIPNANILVSGSNQSPQGQVNINGVAEIGATLIATTETVLDRDGIRGDTRSIQWFRDGVPIEGADGSEYTLTSEDFESVITAQLSYSDFFNRKEQVSSADFPFGVTEAPKEELRDPDAGLEGGGRKVSDGVNDTPVSATVFSDVFTIRDGIDYVNGLAGLDTAVFTGDLSHYTITENSTGIVVTDGRTDGHGRVILENVEFIRFELPDTNGIDFIDLRATTSILNENSDEEPLSRESGIENLNFNLSIDETNELIEIYMAHFNRIPDAPSLAYWGEIYESGSSFSEIARMFRESPEVRGAYPEDENPVRILADVYDNVFGRTPDWAGFSFWLEALRSGDIEQDGLIFEMLQEVDILPQDVSSQVLFERKISDQKYLNMKTDLGFQFAVEHGLTNVQDAIEIFEIYDGSEESFVRASAAIDMLYVEAIQLGTDDAIMPLVGILGNNDGFDVL